MGSDEPEAGSSEVRRLEERVRELERMLAQTGGSGEVGIKKTELAARRGRRTLPDEGGRRCTRGRWFALHEKVRRLAKPRGSYRKP